MDTPSDSGYGVDIPRWPPTVAESDERTIYPTAPYNEEFKRFENVRIGKYQPFAKQYLDNPLKRSHITAIAFSGFIGIGLFIGSGTLIGLAGSLGCVLSFIVAGIIVTGVMRSLAEMVSTNPTHSALMEYPCTYVDDALGFAVGATYCAAECVSVGVLTAAAVRVAENFRPEHPLTKGQKAGITIGFYFATLFSNALGVRIYGNLERFVKWVKMTLIVGLCVLMIVVNLGVGGYPTENKSYNYTEKSFTPFFNAFGFGNLSQIDTNANDLGIPGSGGAVLAVFTCITLAVFACMGGDLVIMTAGEAKTPRKDLAPVACFMYLVPIGLYILTTFLVGFNINYEDPDLARPYLAAGDRKFYPASPFIIVLNHTSLAPKTLTTVLSALFMFSSYTAANTALYASSRALFGMAHLFGNKAVKSTIGRTSAGHTPHVSIAICSVGGLIALLGLTDESSNQPILSLSAFFTGSLGCVYAAECVAYLRFWSGLRELEKRKSLSRDDDKYKGRYYRAHWQPLWAIIGLVGSIWIVVFTGWVSIYLILARDHLHDDTRGLKLKNKMNFGWDLVGAYSGPIIFLLLLFGYKFFMRTRIQRFDDFNDTYLNPRYPVRQDDLPSRPKSFGAWIWEIWTFIR